MCLTRIPWIPCSSIFSRNLGYSARFQKHSNSGNQLASKDAATNSVIGASDLRIQRIKINSHTGEVIRFDAVIQDTMPSGSSVGTVIACHGAPGSHNDFKHFLPYLKDRAIRFIGINFPGFGFTLPDQRLRHDNRERLEFVREIVEHLKLKNNLVFVGHSRGSETVLKLGAIFKERTVAVVLINPMGLIDHRGIRPLWRLTLFVWLWNLGTITQFFLKPLIYLLYKYVLKIRAETGEVAATCVFAMRNVDLSSQNEYIRILNNSNVRVFIAHAGRDWFIEPEISENFADSFSGVEKLICGAGAEGENIVSDHVKRVIDEGKRRVSVYFPEDGHFLQKYRAKLLANAVYWMLNDETERHFRRKAHL
uniref:AB hydrolase-1 domain-containing protein n=2 Tax=Parascaris univalens TaxID=6257 RepID=A0A915C2H9_PARUN